MRRHKLKKKNSYNRIARKKYKEAYSKWEHFDGPVQLSNDGDEVPLTMKPMNEWSLGEIARFKALEEVIEKVSTL